MAKINPIQVQKFLKGVDYPTGKRELIEHARRQGADEAVLDILEQIPMERFNSANDVAEGIGRIREAA
jgi:hypothetical protein